MASAIQFEQWVPVSIEQVFIFFANPENLPRIMPPWTETHLLETKLQSPPEREGLAGIGSEIVTSFRLFPVLPIRARWTARITEFEWNHHFADVQTKGPFKMFHHRHEFSAETREGIRGTVIRDVIDYELGFGWLGKLAGRVQVGPQLQRTFAYRQAALMNLLK